MIFPTPMKQLLSFKLSRLLQDGQYIDEEMLLRAYTTFKLEELEEADRPRMNDIAIPLQRNEEYDNANRFFTSYGISDLSMSRSSFADSSIFQIPHFAPLSLHVV